LKNFKRKV